MREEDVTKNSCVCSRDFPGGNILKTPAMTLGKGFASPIKKGERAKRAKQRDETRQLSPIVVHENHCFLRMALSV